MGAMFTQAGRDWHGLSDSVNLQDGRVIDDVLIVGGTITEVRGCDTIPFAVEDISDIRVTHRKWEFRR
jgi:hypothetical protein